jgi:hypothetical protein
MTTRFLGRFVCLFRGHRWRVEFNGETQGTEADCSRCGAHSTDPEARRRRTRPQPSPHTWGRGPGGNAGGMGMGGGDAGGM